MPARSPFQRYLLPHGPSECEVCQVLLQGLSHGAESCIGQTPAQSHTVGASSSRIAAAWIKQYPDRPLHAIADHLKPNHVPEATGRGIDRYLAMWSLEHPEMLNASADDLLNLHGVGPKRRSQLVEMVVNLAVDGVDEPVKVEAEPVPEVAPEASEPTPDELLAAAYDPLHASVPTQSTP